MGRFWRAAAFTSPGARGGDSTAGDFETTAGGAVSVILAIAIAVLATGPFFVPALPGPESGVSLAVSIARRAWLATLPGWGDVKSL